MPNKNPQPQHTRTPPQNPQQAGQKPSSSDVGKDTDNDGRVVQPGHRAGEVDGAQQRRAQAGKSTGKTDWVGKDTDGDGRVVKPGQRPGEIDGDRQKQKQKH